MGRRSASACRFATALVDRRQPGHALASLRSGAAGGRNKEHLSSCIPRFSLFPSCFCCRSGVTILIPINNKADGKRNMHAALRRLSSDGGRPWVTLQVAEGLEGVNRRLSGPLSILPRVLSP